MQHFPSISEDEFQEACQLLDERARTTKAPDGNASFQCAYVNGVLSITKEYLISASQDSSEEAKETAPNEDDSDELTEDEDHEIMSRPCHHSQEDSIHVEFSILRSATYEVPVLWFTIKRVPNAIPNSAEAVYRWLVPKAIRPSLRWVGVMGGISISHHPVTALPAFFIHPCNTAKALEDICEDKACSPEEYLVIWLGLVGPSVNLYIPSQLLPLDSRGEQ